MGTTGDVATRWPMKLRQLLLLSPLLVISAGFIVAHFSARLFGVWAWIPLSLVYWSVLALLIAAGGGVKAMRQRLVPLRGRYWGWAVLGMAVGLLPLPVLLTKGAVLQRMGVWLPWLLFALVNPWLEESYWRGVLSDATASWKRWPSVLYSSALFAISHPLMWGVFSAANRTVTVVAATFLMGVAWSWIYLKTRSLRWPLLSHAVVDLLNLSVPVFMNLYVPSGKWW